MAKIAVYEDSHIDAELRYGSLLDDHEFHIYFTDLPGVTFEEIKPTLTEIGFHPERIYFGLPDEPMKADAHFVDGLRGDCMKILPKLPKDKAYMVSINLRWQEEAEKLGYEVLDDVGITKTIRSLPK